MTQQDMVRERILAYGLGVASAQGLQALSLGDMARDLELPRSGLSRHFSSKDALQLGVLEQAAEIFITDVVEPGEAMPAGEARLRTLFGRWLAWSRSPRLKGGCPFVHASAEGHALPVDVRAKLTEVLDGWTAILKAAIEDGKGTAFKEDADADQLVFELYALYLSHHHWHWAMRDQTAFARTMKAFERLLASATA